MKNEFNGTIVEKSLEDNRILNELEIVGFRITNEENPDERWHIYKVSVSKDEIQKLSRLIKPSKWYMHFWKGKNVIAVFKNKTFEFNSKDKATWKPAVEYGLSIGIPKEQLDFLID